MNDAGHNESIDVCRRWLQRLQQRDPALHADLLRRYERFYAERQEIVLESAEEVEENRPDDQQFEQMVLETIVRDGRPALLVQKNAITFEGVEADAASEEIIGRLQQAKTTVEPILPLVGRIDAANYAGTAPFLGTGWLVDTHIVVTNRHVAELMANSDGARFVFKPGRLGEKLLVSIDYRREFAVTQQAAARVKRVLWIEPNPRKADIAFLEVDVADDRVARGHLTLAEHDASDQDAVAVIGYPARASRNSIPDQTRMDKIYGGTYEIKRIAPGLMGGGARGWATHDCTTLGGNSGSVVIDLKTGSAVALHFAGLYMIENYAVPASTIRGYLEDRPWQGSSNPQPPPEPAHPVSVASTSTAAASIEQAARAFARDFEKDGVLACRPGAVFANGKLSDEEGLIVAVHPEHVTDLARRLPENHSGFAVVVGPASITDQLGDSADALGREAVTSIEYNDQDRTGSGFSLDWVKEPMELRLHVGPERSWSELRAFLRDANGMVSSMYEFHAAHIADAIRARLDAGSALTLVLARQTRNPRHGKIGAGDFDREQTFALWEQSFREQFKNVYVPVGSSGLVANSYHIKVTVCDADKVWLSSGNWKRASQPLLPEQDLDDPRLISSAGNREWHVIVKGNRTLADRLRKHIVEDFRKSLDLGGTTEGIGEEVLVDVPRVLLDAIELEAPASRVIEPLVIPLREVRVKPLLTPDREGTIYTDAVLELIESARKQLVLQNQYIKFAGVKTGNLKNLVDALCAKSTEVEDCRIILRSGGDGFWDDMRALQRNGLDVNRCVSRLANTHTKGIVVDGNQVLVGSHNWSTDGVTLNRDASLIFDDKTIAQYFLDAFEVDWMRASKLEAPEAAEADAPRVAAGEISPPGFVRMTLSEYLEG